MRRPPAPVQNMSVEMSSNPMMTSEVVVEEAVATPGGEDAGSNALTVDEMLSLHVGEVFCFFFCCCSCSVRPGQESDNDTTHTANQKRATPLLVCAGWHDDTVCRTGNATTKPLSHERIALSTIRAALCV